MNGGGVTGQTDAVKLGLARALLKINVDWTSSLRKFGLLTHDRACQGTQEAGPQASSQGPNLHQAVIRQYAKRKT